jgi:cysteinyl-tRNA synthetase
MEYSEASVQAAQNGFQHLQNQIRELKSDQSHAPGSIDPAYRGKFLGAINDDLNMPRAMAVVQEMLKSGGSESDKLTTVLDFDRVLGFDLDKVDKTEILPAEIQQMVDARHKARQEKNWAESDRLRDEIEARGYVVQDTRDGMKVFKS